MDKKQSNGLINILLLSSELYKCKITKKNIGDLNEKILSSVNVCVQNFYNSYLENKFISKTTYRTTFNKHYKIFISWDEKESMETFAWRKVVTLVSAAIWQLFCKASFQQNYGRIYVCAVLIWRCYREVFSERRKQKTIFVT